MKNANKAWLMLPALVLLLAACATGGMQAGTGTHLSAVECRDQGSNLSGRISRISQVAKRPERLMYSSAMALACVSRALPT